MLYFRTRKITLRFSVLEFFFEIYDGFELQENFLEELTSAYIRYVTNEISPTFSTVDSKLVR